MLQEYLHFNGIRIFDEFVENDSRNIHNCTGKKFRWPELRRLSSSTYQASDVWNIFSVYDTNARSIFVQYLCAPSITGVHIWRVAMPRAGVPNYLIRRGRRYVKRDKVNTRSRVSFFFGDPRRWKGSKMSLPVNVKSAVELLNRFRCLGIERLTEK